MQFPPSPSSRLFTTGVMGGGKDKTAPPRGPRIVSHNKPSLANNDIKSINRPGKATGGGVGVGVGPAGFRFGAGGGTSSNVGAVNSRYVANLRDQVHHLEEELNVYKHRDPNVSAGIPAAVGCCSPAPRTLHHVERAIESLRDQYHSAAEDHENHLREAESRHDAELATIRREAAKKMEELAQSHRDFERDGYHRRMSLEARHIDEVTRVRDVCLGLEKECDGLSKKLEQVTLERDATEKLANNVRTECTVLEEHLRSMTDRYRTAAEELSQVKSELAHARARAAVVPESLELEKAISRMKQSNAGNEERIAYLESILKEREQELREARDELQALQRKFDKEVVAHRTQVAVKDSVDVELASTRVQLAEATTELEYYRNRCGSLTEELEYTQRRCDTLASTLQQEVDRRSIVEVGQQRIGLQTRQLEERATAQRRTLEESIKAQESLREENEKLHQLVADCHRETLQWKEAHGHLLKQVKELECATDLRVDTLKENMQTLRQQSEMMHNTTETVATSILGDVASGMVAHTLKLGDVAQSSTLPFDGARHYGGLPSSAARTEEMSVGDASLRGHDVSTTNNLSNVCEPRSTVNVGAASSTQTGPLTSDAKLFADVEKEIRAAMAREEEARCAAELSTERAILGVRRAGNAALRQTHGL